ncbi:MAG: patatin-like phospholipase family protein [Bacteroidales bacterium]|jgi:NTE family protein|nr:patatin-like phospholipase family protein [Bacteroidales bacterium]
MKKLVFAQSGILLAMVILITTSQPLRSQVAVDTSGRVATAGEWQPGKDHDTVSPNFFRQPLAEPDSATPSIPARNLSRPVLGLALSGGGAKGLAHIGVIRVMEEAGLKPDYISGVSMGSIVGAMYAMGYTPDSIAHLFRSFDWEPAMSDRIPENKIIFLEKKHFHNSLISLPITRNAIKIPSGLISGQQIESGLNHYFWPAATITDFSRLPIPFLCLATDVITARRVVFRSGYLPDAIRASIAIPSVFTPVRTDTAILVDGGVVRNYSVSELREMGVDIVIGSYVSFKGYKEKDLESAYGILKQIGFLSSLADYEQQKQLTDILLEPEIGEVSTLSFNNPDSIIEKGYREALKHMDVFKRLADSLDSFGPRSPVIPLPDVKYYIFDSIRVTGNKIISEDQIIGVLDVRPGENVDRTILEERIDLLYGKNWFEKVRYRIIPEGDILTLEIDCIERPRAMLYGSLHYDPALSAGAVIGLSVRDLITPRSVINVDSYIGQYYRFRLSAIQFIDRSQKFGVEGSFFADNTRLPLIHLKNETGPMLSQNYNTQLSLSKRLSLNHLMTLSLSFENQHLTPDYVTATQIKRLTYDYYRLNYTYQANTLNKKHFPEHGINSGLSLSTTRLLKAAMRVGSDRLVFNPGDEGSPFSFDRNYAVRAWLNSYSSASERVTINFGGDIILSTGTDSVTSGNDFWLLGGMEAITERSVTASGFHPNQIMVRNTAGARFGIDVEIATDLHLTSDINLFALREPHRIRGYTLMGGCSIGAGYMTVAGPVRIGIMYGFYDRQVLYRNVKGYVGMGFTF